MSLKIVVMHIIISINITASKAKRGLSVIKPFLSYVTEKSEMVKSAGIYSTKPKVTSFPGSMVELYSRGVNCNKAFYQANRPFQ